MNARRKDHLVDMINAIRCLQSEWTDMYQWTLHVQELEVKPLQLNDYEVSIMVESENEACILLLLLQNVTDLNVGINDNGRSIKCR